LRIPYTRDTAAEQPRGTQRLAGRAGRGRSLRTGRSTRLSSSAWTLQTTTVSAVQSDAALGHGPMSRVRRNERPVAAWPVVVTVCKTSLQRSWRQPGEPPDPAAPQARSAVLEGV